MPSLDGASRFDMRHFERTPQPSRSRNASSSQDSCESNGSFHWYHAGVHSSFWNGSLPSSSDTFSPSSGVRLHSVVSNCSISLAK
jgi:hypothetical protein